MRGVVLSPLPVFAADADAESKTAFRPPGM